MAEGDAHRAEEAAFLADMPGDWARALRRPSASPPNSGSTTAASTSACGRRRVLLFEANPGMVIQPPGPEPIWDYRRAPIGRALDAVKALLPPKPASRSPLSPLPPRAAPCLRDERLVAGVLP